MSTVSYIDFFVCDQKMVYGVMIGKRDSAGEKNESFFEKRMKMEIST
jgi:hypothetical protein